MIKKILYRIISVFCMFYLSTAIIGVSNTYTDISETRTYYQLLYDNIWGAIYNAESNQCDDSPLVTGNNFKINPKKASEHRIIAISPDMLDSPFRANLMARKYPNNDLFKGKIEYGETIYIESPHKEINGFWRVEDAKSSKPQFKQSIDFLQTKGDGSLYNDNPLWCGKFDSIKIYRIINIKK